MAVGERPAHANRPVANGVSDDQLPSTLGEQSRGTCGEGEPSPGADVAGARPVPAQMRQGRAQSQCRCGRRGTSPGADVAGARQVPDVAGG
jgi:hypothetical protein